jgi:predicted nucleic acid-binding protein
MRAYIDADVLIWHLRGEPKALRFLQSLRGRSEYELWTGAMQRAEVVFFMRPHEAEATLLFMAQLKTAPVDQAVVDAAGTIYRIWNPSHGVDPNDALLAATVQHTGGKLYCLNTKHYPMPDIVVERAW